MTATIRMTPADVDYLVQWEKQYHFTIEFLYNGGASARFEHMGSTRCCWRSGRWPRTSTGSTTPGPRPTSAVRRTALRAPEMRDVGGHIVWAVGPSLINSQIIENFAWAKSNGIPAEPGVLASGEYSGLPVLPQQPVDNPSWKRRWARTVSGGSPLDATRERDMRYVGAALGVPRRPIDVGYDADTVARRSASTTGKHVEGRRRQRDLPGQQAHGLPQAAEPGRPDGPRTSLPGQVQIVF